MCINSGKYFHFRKVTINKIVQDNIGINAIRLKISEITSKDFLEKFKGDMALEHKICTTELAKDKVFLDFIAKRFNEPLFPNSTFTCKEERA